MMIFGVGIFVLGIVLVAIWWAYHDIDPED